MFGAVIAGYSRLGVVLVGVHAGKRVTRAGALTSGSWPAGGASIGGGPPAAARALRPCTCGVVSMGQRNTSALLR